MQNVFDPQIPNPTSLILNGLSANSTLDDLYESLFLDLNIYYQILKNRHFKKIDELYNDALWKRNHVVLYEQDGQTKSAKLLNVGDDGKLEIEDEMGRKIKLHHGEIKILV